MSAVADGSGIYTIVSQRTLFPGTAPIKFTPCDGGPQTDLATVNVLEGPFNPENIIVQDQDYLYVAEAGQTIARFAKADGARTDIVTGETALWSLGIRVETDDTVLAWVANDALKN